MKYPDVERIAEGLIGRIRSVGIHAGGLVVSKEPISWHSPIETREDPQTGERIPVTVNDMEEIADVGLIKMDYLGLTALSIVSDALDAIETRTGVRPDLAGLDYSEPEIFDMLSSGDTVGVFQAEATPYTALLMKMGVSNFDELAVSNALVRPGAMNTIGDLYMRRKDGRDAVSYMHPIMQEFTNETYGLVLYQEQVMLACTKLAGMSMSDANRVRKIIGKKKDPHEFDKFRDAFIDGATQHISRKQAESLWHDFEAHAGYSFNKSHAVAYSMLTYWTAWLKYHYPVEFMWAILRNQNPGNKADKLKIVRYLIAAKKAGIRILLPDVNKSGVKFEIEGDAIRFGLSNIKYISDKTAEPLIRNRPFNNYAELLELMHEKGSGINERTVSALNKVGAARLEGNNSSEDVRSNLWEFLGVPHFDKDALNEVQLSKISPLDYFNEENVFFFLGMVTDIKRGKGWSRVTMIDETGMAAVFAGENTQIEMGQQYLFLVGGNTIVRYIDVREVEEMQDDIILKFLARPQLKMVEGEYLVLALSKRMTKKGDMMGTLVVSNHLGHLESALVFPNGFHKINAKARPGTVVTIEFSKTQDETLFVRELDNAR
jgi:DNA polymerase-3 subunit alpha